MLDLIAYFLVKGINRVLHVLPMDFSLWLGRRCGAVIYALAGKRRNIAYANLKAAFYAEKTPQELKRLTRNVYSHMGETFAELIAMTKVDKNYVEKYIKIHNLDRVDRASRNPEGMLFASAHFGNWELCCVASVAKGYALHLIARDQKMRRLNELFNKLRETKGNFVIRKGMDIKNVFRVLHAGKSVGLLGDQNAGANGQLVDFFGRPASLAQGPYRFAQKCGAWILPAFIWRVKGPYHEVMIEEPMVIGEGDDLEPYMQKYNELLEKHIRAHPEQWMWMHKRWKVTPLKRILVLDDGRKGHLKQSLAVVKQISKYRQDKGFKTEDTPVDTVRISFKDSFRKSVFNFISPFTARKAQGKLRLMRWALDPESYEAAVMRHADIIVSCGSSLAGVNLYLKAENYSRSVTVLAPASYAAKRFDLIIMPSHDLKGKKIPENTVVTELAPNLIDPAELSSLRKAHDGLCIGLLAGGENPYFAFSSDLAEQVSVGLKAACGRTGGHFYATTSRRTPPESDEVFKELLGGDTRSLGFVTGKDDRDERTVEKILASGDVIVVSGESISMVSEAVASGKPVLVFMPEKRTAKVTKYEKFVDGLAAKGFLKRVEPRDIAAEASSAAQARAKLTLPEDNKRIYERAYKLF